MTRLVAIALLAGLALLPTGAEARGGTRVIIIRLEGYLGPPPEGKKEQADLTLQVDDKNRRFQVVDSVVTAGNRMTSQVFDSVSPYTPSFILRGPKELLSRVRDGADGTRLVINGQWLPGSRNLVVGSVEPKR
jgi:hypothetical protein